MGVDRSDWPIMVRLGLWGVSSRRAAWAFCWLSLVIAAGCAAYGFINPFGYIGGLMVFAALWYYLSIRWVDRHSRWS
jgi:hypothetical protein